MPTTSKKPVPPFVVFEGKDKDKPKVLPPLLAQYFRDTETYITVIHNTTGQTHRYIYQDGCYRPLTDDMLKGILKRYVADYDLSLVNMAKIREAHQDLCTDLKYIEEAKLNEREDLINFRNGILKVTPSVLEFHPHDPRFLSTIQIPCDWTGSAQPTPVFDSFLDTLTDGNDEVKQLLLEYIGVCISNVKGWRLKKALIFFGPGNAGKSVLKTFVERTLGPDNYIAIDLEQIEARFGTASLYGKRLAGSSDMSYMSIDELKSFKQLTGGDSVFAEHKGEKGFHFVYNGLLWFCTNELPRFGGDNGQWVYDRIIAIECKNQIPPEKQDKQILEKLYAERDGIIYKAILAMQKVVINGYKLDEPQEVSDLRQEYIATNSSVLTFMDECLVSLNDPNSFVQHLTTSVIYDAYRNWCKTNVSNGHTETRKQFRDCLSHHMGIPYKDLTTHLEQGQVFLNLNLTWDAYKTYAPKPVSV